MTFPDIADETVQQLISAFDGAVMHGWENDDDQTKINHIKRALYDILGDEEQTEKAFACIAKHKYNVTFEPEQSENIATNGDAAETENAANEFILSSIPESKFDAMKPFMPDNIPYQTEVRDGMMAFAVAPDQVKDFRDALENAVNQAKTQKEKAYPCRTAVQAIYRAVPGHCKRRTYL